MLNKIMKNYYSRLNVLYRARWSRIGFVVLLLLLLVGSVSFLPGQPPLATFAVYTFDPYGNFKTRFAPFGLGTGQISPSKVAVDHNGNILVTDGAHGVVVIYDHYGNRKGQFGTGHLGAPVGIVLTPAGQILVSDFGGIVARFDSLGTYLGQFSRGSTFWCPEGMALRSNGNILVTDYCNSQIVEFDGLGTLRSTFGTGWVFCPFDVAVRSNGDTYVADGCNDQQIQVFDLNGNHRLSFGTVGSGPGQLLAASAVALTPNGNVLVADTYNSRMQEFDPYGNFLHLIFGNQPGPGQLSLPGGIAFQADGTIIVTNVGCVINNNNGAKHNGFNFCDR